MRDLSLLKYVGVVIALASPLVLSGCFQYTSPGVGGAGSISTAQSMYHSRKGASPSLERELKRNLAAVGPKDEKYYFYDVKYITESELTHGLAQHKFILGRYEEAAALFQQSFDLIEAGEENFFRYTKQKKQEMEVYQSFIGMLGQQLAGRLGTRDRILATRMSKVLKGFTETGEIPDKDRLFIGEKLPENTAKRVLSGQPAFDMGGIAHVHSRFGSCTGFHIAPGGFVLTNAHCVTGEDNSHASASSVTVRFDNPLYSLELPVKKIHFNEKYQAVAQKHNVREWLRAFQQDWAFLELHTIPAVGVLPIAVQKQNGDGTFEAGPIGTKGKGIVAGYSGDLNDGRFMSMDIGCDWKDDKKARLILHNCESSGGSSGSPILTVTQGSLSYFGINAGTLLGRNVSVPISSFADKLNEILTYLADPKNAKKKMLPEEYGDRFFRYYHEIRKSVFGDIS